MSAINTRQSIPAILNALVTALTAAQWLNPVSSSFENAFGAVKLFDVTQLADAFSELLISQTRVCLVIPDTERFESAFHGNTKLLMKRTLPVAILVSDSVIAKRQLALYGGANIDGTPVAGAFNLMEIALSAVTGQLIRNAQGAGGIVCKPLNSSILDVQDTRKKMPGRACVELDVECSGGTLEATINPNL